ncbi:MAG: AAA family ATPase [Chloroflexi bacterium]|nr:AAA family ATPase [Chloroflexota bacterium]
MEWRFYLAVLWRRKWGIAATIAAALVMVALGNRSSVPYYESNAVLRVAIYATASQAPTLYTYNDELKNTFVKIATSTLVMEELANRLQSPRLPSMTVEVITGTELILITAADADPELAARAANTLGEILVEQGRSLYSGSAVNAKDVLGVQLEQSRTELDEMRKEYEKLLLQTPPPSDEILVASQLLLEKQRTYETLLRQYEQAVYREGLEAGMITLVQRAEPSQTPIGQTGSIAYFIAIAAGLVAGIFLAFAIERLDTRVYATKEIESVVSATPLAKFPKTGSGHLLLSQNGTSPLADSVRHLAANLQLMSNNQYHKVLLLVGAETGQGTTTTAANLADALTELGRNVLLVDCNLRDPKLHQVFDLPNDKGLTDVLADNVDPMKVIQKKADGRPSLLLSGPAPASSSLVFASARIGSLFNTLRKQFDYVIIDVPALPAADIINLAPNADEIILMVRRSHVRRDSIRSAEEFLSRFKDKFIGLVVNEAESQGIYSLS